MAKEIGATAEESRSGQGRPNERPGVLRPATRHLVSSHLRFGWRSLLLFLTLGAVLETMHGLKVGWYLDVANDARRLMWTLAHAHGTLLSLVHVAFAATVYLRSVATGGEDQAGEKWLPRSSSFLTASTFLLPGGFFLGGIFVHGGDPGLAVLLVPFGAVCLFVSVVLTLRGLSSAGERNTGSS